MTKRLRLQFLVGIVISLLFLYLAFRGVKFGELKQALAAVNYGYLLPTIALVLTSFLLRAYRWGWMVAPIKKARFENLFASTMIGFMANNVLPLRLGEIGRAYSLGHLEKISRSAALATIILERFFDTLALLILLLVILVWFPFTPELRRITRVAVLLTVLAFAFLIFLKLKGPRAAEILARLLRVLPRQLGQRAGEIITKFSGGLGLLSQPGRVVVVLFYSVVIYVVLALASYPVFLAFGLHSGWLAPLLLFVVVSLGLVVPAAPGFIGTFEWLTIQSLTLFGIAQSTAQAFAIVLHACHYIPVTLVGLYYLRKKHLSLVAVEKVAAADEPLAAPEEKIQH